MTPLPTECWALRRPDGGLVPPIDEDGTDVFMAWPTREQAEKGLVFQLEDYWDEDDPPPVVVRLF